MKNYDPKKIEIKWQKEWEKKKIYQVKDFEKDKFYSLVEFPYPSGEGLHVGHPRPYIGMDIISRKRRMEGQNVLFPFGWDAFGLPTENYAIKTGIQPSVITKKNTDNFRRQIKSLGISFDWSREINTTDPNYYKWTQWIFLQLFKKGLAYKAKININWCPKDKIGLANEEVIDGKCERCGTETIKKEKEQWMLGITKYAERLDKDLDLVDYPERVKLLQKNWIGKSEGSEIEFKISCGSPTSAESKNCLIAHGLRGKPEENWFPWLKNNLEKENWKVSIPSLPNAEHPIISEWTNVLVKELNPDGVVIGHSLGALAVLNLIQTENKKIKKLILVAPANPGQDWRELKKKFNYADWDACRKFAEIKFDWKKISKLANEIIIYYSDDDKFIPLKSIEYFKENLPKAIFKFRPGMKHFNSGAGILEFPEILEDIVSKIKVFTTRADTLFGATYVVFAPEHPLIKNLELRITNWKEVEEYIKSVKKKSDLERTENKIKTGIELKGIKAINPANTQALPVWIADYVLPHYGTGAVMAVPAHDERDFEFAKKYNLPMRTVIKKHLETSILFVNRSLVSNWKEILLKNNYKWSPRENWGIDVFISDQDLNKFLPIAQSLMKEGPYYFSTRGTSKIIGYKDKIFDFFVKDNDYLAKEFGRKLLIPEKELDWSTVMVDEGILVNSGKFDNLNSKEAIKKITEFVGGKMVTKFKLRDWVFSRQRYWGEPIPIIHCEKCGEVPVPEKDLPVKLPKVKSYKPTDTGESPLAGISKWVNVKCPKCKGKAKRETDTMPNWAGSSWYYLRYTDPKNKKVFADKKKLKYWTPVNWYNGGMEHTTLHLLYSRFWHKFLFDLKLVPTVEPYMKRTSHGMILGEGGVKMSKSLGNVVNPDEIVKIYGADTLRVYEMFLGPFEETAVWNTESIIGSRRFLEKVWRIEQKVKSCKVNKVYKENINLIKLLHKTIKKVSEDIEKMNFNTAISSMMIFANEVERNDFQLSTFNFQLFVKILAPFAPHTTEEIWNLLGEKKTIHFSKWPKWDENLMKDNEIKIAVQVNGKVRAEIMIEVGDSEEDIKRKALENEAVFKFITGKEIKKIIYVKHRLINIVH